MEIRSGSVFFPRSRGSGPRTANSSPLVFPRQVLRAVAGLTGYTAQYVSEDHHLGQFRVQLNPQVVGNTVTVVTTFGLRDWSGEWDDDYAGTVNFTVLVDLESVTAPPPRGDLQIVDAEFNQVIQFFQSARFLDPVNVRPDNSVPLMERKPTGVRLYVDYDASVGLPSIASLSGEIEIVSPVGTRTIDPISPITPQREFLIQRSQSSHTLNFRIPEELCVGVVTLRARVFSTADPTSRSALFERTVQFVNMPSLRIYLVGVNFTGQGMNLPAPTQTQMMATLNLTERLFPTGELLVAGSQVLVFNQNLNPNGASGCGPGFGALLDELEDLQGSSSDIYYAELPAGVNTGNVAGCARSSGVASVGSGISGSAAHEVSHALGVQHTPCGPCPSQPSNPNNDYPQYNGFSRNSIGEFGYDPLNDTVFNPATTFDLMAPGVAPRWMSPYNYSRLFSALGGSFGGAGPFGDSLPKVPVQVLHLRLTIQRDGRVTREHSFHFPSTRIGNGGHPTNYTVEFLDEKGNSLACHCLSCSCSSCGPNCYPAVIRDRVPMPIEARTLRVWEGREKMLHEEEIPERPEVEIDQPKKSKEGMILEWSPKPAFRGADLQFLVQFEDGRGVWRGIGPRSEKRNLLIPFSFFKRRKALRVRVLASSGIATGISDYSVEPQFDIDPGLPLPDDDAPPVIVSAGGALEPGKAVGAYLRATSSPMRTLRWYDEAGAELSQSGTLDVHGLPDGQNTVTVVAVGAGRLQTAHSILIEKSGSRATLLRDFDSPLPIEPHVHPHAPQPRRQRKEK